MGKGQGWFTSREGWVVNLTGVFLLHSLRAVAAVIGVFVVCIVVHEFGHFIVAKRAGVAVPVFSIGFGPKLWRFTWRDTEYSLRLFPLGGQIQMAGEIPQDSLFRTGEPLSAVLDDEGRVVTLGDPTDVPEGRVGVLKTIDLSDRFTMTLDVDGEMTQLPIKPGARLMTSKRNFIPLIEKDEQFVGKRPWQKALILLAGPFMNVGLAVVLFGMFFANMGVGLNTPSLGQVIPGSAAAAAGLRQGDEVVSVNGHKVSSWVQLVEEIRKDTSNPPAPLTMLVRRSGRAEAVVVQPARVDGTAQLGVNQPVTHNVFAASKAGISAVYFTSVNAIHVYGQIIHYHEYNKLTGPVGIADAIGQQAQYGFWQVVVIAGLLSLNLALFNLLPIPSLDGGRLVFVVLEFFRGKGVDPKTEGLVHFVSFALIMLFGVVITYRDVTRLF